MTLGLRQDMQYDLGLDLSRHVCPFQVSFSHVIHLFSAISSLLKPSYTYSYWSWKWSRGVGLTALQHLTDCGIEMFRGLRGTISPSYIMHYSFG